MRVSTRRSCAPRYDAIAFTGEVPDEVAVEVAEVVEEEEDPSACREHGRKRDSGRASVVAPWVACSMLRICDRRILWLRVRPARRSLVRRSSTTICSSSCWWATATSASKRSWAASRTAPRSRRSAAAAVRLFRVSADVTELSSIYVTKHYTKMLKSLRVIPANEYQVILRPEMKRTAMFAKHWW